MEKTELWEALSSLFETDDGSLPEVVIGNLDKNAVEQIFQYLKSHADPIENDVLVWHAQLGEEVPLNSIEGLIDLLYRGEVPRIRILLKNISVDGVSLPPIGCLILPSEVELDYKMGKEWNPEKVFNFLRLLAIFQSMKLDANIHISDEGEAPFSPEERKAFKEALQKLISEQVEH
jgi:hypothetical protein